MNQEKHWNSIAPNYEDEIFDVFKSDKNKILPVYFRKHGNKSHRAIDFGCGIGKAFPYLSPFFKEVHAIDISEECLNHARTRPFTNITFQQLDLSNPEADIPKSEFVFCCNVIMLPQVEKNQVMFTNIQRALKPKGNAVIVIPSFESIFYSSWRLIQFYKKQGVSSGEIPRDEFDYFKGNTPEMIEGIMYINGIPTKHYSQPEMEVIFHDAGLTITAVEKVEYSWNTELDSPPAWMKDPYPWDWLVECRKSA